ncbi:GNAT family N-acetyltransferase [Lewinella sp. JB7]|uniref:GNAT family N-acetyltransferase n=1 Tax=Lewinella sp. JB7 TaxID=2962887 RepID=UPI0020C95B59|nr:GNAT family N-acetyltransferase [Lewinella sp. JB7]MCP9237102.1 acetyltransferase [Lewinella sp. JB7]
MVSLRTATPADAGLLESWEKQSHVIEAGAGDDWNWKVELTRRPAWREQLIAEVDGRPLGFVQIIDPAAEETHYWGEIGPHKRAIDIWIGDRQDLGRGYGTQMMERALERCFADPGVMEVLVEPLTSNHRARKFYEKLGFRFLEHRMFGADHSAVYVLRRP